ncbi:hypothetical protein B0T26DRAFT_720007 [Lasiosphaeria miniovina]|uniref:Uncharacterized protein n=1 Tax=Lasiosphaeria miniovina TaxID=1954250 RepID=A0AA40DMT7_9PEZI|nr:uncharacterized protein B0T26DRAFT_720007 [Lasiosphaeria miniovina]KAK0708965.1 hypothetical protein B0T26DRAFT_720007 [Lasiosphaeria miniovina]
MSQLGKGKSKAHLPALFLHPSNSNSPPASASHNSLPSLVLAATSSSAPHPQSVGQQQQQQHQNQSQQMSSAPAPGLGRSGSLRRSDAGSTVPSTVEPRGGGVGAAATLRGGPLNLNLPLPQLTRGESTRTTDRTDALWAEMQATLEEVELSATGGTRVFGPDHERKLSELRTAQIALAQAWARSEADDAIETTASNGIGEASMAARDLKASAVGGGAASDGAGKAAAESGATAAATIVAANAAIDGGARSTAGTGSARPGSSGMGGGGQERLGAKLEEETEVDILLARKRREANDRYFQRVNQGVLDVVAKLEDVATAMRAVEQESKDIWGDGENDSVPGSVKT